MLMFLRLWVGDVSIEASEQAGSRSIRVKMIQTCFSCWLSRFQNQLNLYVSMFSNSNNNINNNAHSNTFIISPMFNNSNNSKMLKHKISNAAEMAHPVSPSQRTSLISSNPVVKWR